MPVDTEWQALQDSFLHMDPDKGPDKGVKIKEDFGGVAGLATKLGSDVENGIPADDNLDQRKKLFGENSFATPPLATYLELFLATFEDPVLLILLGAVVVALVVGMLEDAAHGWHEAVAIFISVLVVSNVCAASDYRKQLQFEKLFKKGEEQEVSVVRAGQIVQVDKSELLVGDIVKLKTGDKVPADGVICPNTVDDLQLNEADLTGESMPLEKTDDGDVYVHADTFVVTGNGSTLVVAVGKDTLTGKIKEELMEKEEEETPLQSKLGVMAELIGYVGIGAAILTLIAIVIRKAANGWEWKALLDGFIVAVTIVVVAVPEGLPLAVTIALAYSMNAMYDENIFVKVLSACETMGGATCICSDKTGTLTQGVMTVTAVHAGGKVFEGDGGQGCVPGLEGELKELFAYGIAVNSDAQVKEMPMNEEQLRRRKADDTSTTTIKRIGNFTECALIVMLNGLSGQDKYLEQRKQMEQEKLKVKMWPFDSAKKRMSVVVATPGGQDRLFMKGAAEQVLKLCTKVMKVDSTVEALTDDVRTDLEKWLQMKTSGGFRLLCMAYKEMQGSQEYGASPPDDELTLLGITAILDPLREEVPYAVECCKRAGIKVVMVTGDHKDTAKYIAGQCGIFMEADDGVVMEATTFRRMYDEAFLAQHGTRMQRYVQSAEKQEGDEIVTTLSPYKAADGGEVPWQQAIGPVCGKPPKHTQVGSKEKADYYEGFGSLVRGKPPQLDMWAYGVDNEYDPSSWPAATQASVEELRVAAVKAYLEENHELKEKCAKDGAALSMSIANSDMAGGEKAKAMEAVEKLAVLIVPPADFRDKKVMAMSAKERDAADGGPEAAKLWGVVDSVLYKHKDGEPVRSGGLQVLARSLPDDKLKLVRRLMKRDEIVGVTGDGTNDAPALRNANVGLAMGSGTQVARDAAHITILDDNFASIVNAVKWGRNVFDNIRKFLQFQLTVNIVALALTFVMACIVDGDVTKELPLNAVMLLWVNLIMDSMGALALATEKPTDELLNRPPHGKQRLLSVSMMRMNLCQAAFQLVILFILSSDMASVKSLVGYGDGCNLFGVNCCDPDTQWGDDVCIYRQNTLVFNAFVMCQFWNEINCRKLKENNVFERFFDSYMFTAVLIFTLILQFFMVEAGGKGVGTNGLHVVQWLFCFVLGMFSLPVGFIARQIPIKSLEDKYDYGKDIGDEEEEDEEEEVAEEAATGVPMASPKSTES